MTSVLAILPYPLRRAGGQIFRIEQWRKHLETEGISITFAPFLSDTGAELLYRRGALPGKVQETIHGYVRRARVLFGLRHFDLAYLYREAAPLGPPIFEKLLSRRLPFVYDFDDAIYLRASSPANAWAAWLKAPGKTATLCRLARHVIAGNHVLADFACQNSRSVTIVPTTIDTDDYVPRERPPNPRPVVGWIGSLTTVGYVSMLGEALRELKKQYAFDLRVIGGTITLPGVEAVCQAWDADTEIEEIRRFDVGVMPLPDDEWTRGKCGLKALQYMALGIPPVVSPVGANREIVRDGVNGLYASTTREWVDKIALLLGDKGLRRRLGLEARRTIEECYSARVQAPRVAAVLRDAAQPIGAFAG